MINLNTQPNNFPEGAGSFSQTPAQEGALGELKLKGVEGVKVTEKEDKKIIEKVYEDGKLVLELNEDGFIHSMKAELEDTIEIKACVGDGQDRTEITYYYRDGSVETVVHTFTPGSPNYEDPWYILSIDYYRDYLKSRTIRKLIVDILDSIKYDVENIEVDEE